MATTTSADVNLWTTVPAEAGSVTTRGAGHARAEFECGGVGPGKHAVQASWRLQDDSAGARASRGQPAGSIRAGSGYGGTIDASVREGCCGAHDNVTWYQARVQGTATRARATRGVRRPPSCERATARRQPTAPPRGWVAGTGCRDSRDHRAAGRIPRTVGVCTVGVPTKIAHVESTLRESVLSHYCPYIATRGGC